MGEKERKIAHMIFVLFLIFFGVLTRGHFISTDEVLVYQGTKSLWERGTTSIEAFDALESIEGRNGKHYALYNSGQSIAALPFYALGRLVSRGLDRVAPERKFFFAGNLIERPGVRWGGEVEIFFVNLLNSVITALLLVVLFQFSIALGSDIRSALLATLLVGTTTIVASLATGFLQHSSEALFSLAAVYYFYRDRQTPSPVTRLKGGIMLALMLQFRFPSIFALPGILCYHTLVAHRRTRTGDGAEGTKKLLPQLVPAYSVLLVGFFFHFLDQWLKFGKLAAVGYTRIAFDNPMLVGVYGYLFSPGLSIFLFSPLLVLAPWILKEFERRHRLETLLIIGQLTLYLIGYGKYHFWHGLWYFGPRYLSPVVPLLLVPLGPWLSAQKTVRYVWTGVTAGIGAYLQVLSVAVNFWYVVLHEGYLDFAPPYGFLFIPSSSQVVALCWFGVNVTARVERYTVARESSVGLPHWC